MSRASVSAMSMSGMAVRGAMAGGSMIQAMRWAGAFGRKPAMMLRPAKRSSGGPTVPRAPRIPGMT
jgi:hypothetical protein